MNLPALFVHRPIGTTLLAIGIAIAGIIAFNLLPVAPLPQVDFPTISVQASLPGGSAETMATSVATPLEKQLGSIAGITEITSSSSLGSSRITLQFDLSRDIDGAARDVQAAINAASSNLPANLPNNPTYRKVNPADAPIMIIALTSDVYKKEQMYNYATTILQQKLSQVDGVGQVIVGGGSLPAVRVDLNPTALNQYAISLADVRTAIASANTNHAKGQIAVNKNISDVKMNDQLFKAVQYAPLIITYRKNAPIHLSDVATVTDSVEDIRNAGLSNGKPAVIIIIFKQPGANVIKTIDYVHAILPTLKATIPSAIAMNVMMDRTATIRTSLHDVEMTLYIAMVLVIIVAYVFLGDIRSMIIPGVAVPLSLLGTFAFMKLFNFSLDNLSLMALTISTGFVVDDAVVVLENITRHIELGKKPVQAAIHGAREVYFTVVSMSLSLIAVFTPILLMGGIVGRLFREFAMTLSIAILVSLVVSLTVTPMMCAYLLKENVARKQNNKNRFLNFFKKMHEKYQVTLLWVLEHATLILWVTIFTVILNIVLFIFIPKGFFPQQDTGRITGSIQAEQNISFQAMKDILTKYVGIIKQDSAVQNVVGFVGGGSGNSGQIFIVLKPYRDRHISSDAVLNRLRPQFENIAEARLYLQSAQDLMIGGRQGNAQFQYTLSADSLEELNHWAPIVIEKLKKIPGIADVNSDQRNHGLQVYVNVDRDNASRLGVTSRNIDTTLYAAFGQSQVSTMYTAMNQYHVIMEAAPQYWQRPETLNLIYVPSSTGKMIPLSTIARFTSSATLLSVNHQGQTPSATLSFNLLPNIALGDAVSAVSEVMKSLPLPASIHGSFKGSAQAFQTSLENEPILICMAIVAVYIVLGILYESFMHPITILSTLPSAGVGALLALLFSRIEMSIIALIGIILLIGIVKKNAIMMIDFSLHLERSEKKSPRDAIYEAAILRFRPIMMTTMAALLGALPLVFGFGLGSELRRPLGIAIVGGLIVSQILTLYTTPVVYLALGNSKVWLNKKWKKLIVSNSNLQSSN